MKPLTLSLFLTLTALFSSFADSARDKVAEGPKERDTPSAARPNILFIFTDDQSTRTVSCYPDARPWASTPNIDALAAEGVRFQSVYMAPFCVPARITQLTGNLPHAARGNFNGDTLTGDALEEEIRRHPFWPQHLRESGYHTGMIGKWHVYSRMPAIGIDWDYAAHWHKKMVNAYYYDQKISINGADPIPLGGYSVDRHTDLAIDYIKERARGDQPWYLWLCYSSPHSPQTPAKRHAGKLDHITHISLPPSFPTPRVGKPNYVQKKPMPKTSAIEDLVRRYHECILSIDENVGRLTEALRESSQLDNTIVVFTSDQGLGMGHHGHVKKKSAPYEGTLSAPLIFRYPRLIPANTICTEPVIGPDLVQTFHELAGIEAPPTMDGQSLLPLLEKPKSKLGRDVVLMTNTRTSFSEGIPNGVKRRNREAIEIDEMPMWTMIRNGKYKYATYTGEEAFEEIYDLKSDPHEMTNLTLSPEHRDLLIDLRQKAATELRQTQSGFEDGHFIDFFPKLKEITAPKNQL
jgi:arylsulfatase A-like enzyme